MLDISGGADAAYLIRVNGVTRSLERGGHPSAQSLFIEQDVLPGANRIEAWVTARGGDPAGPALPLRTPPPDALRFTWRVRGDEVRPGEGGEGTVFMHPLADGEWSCVAAGEMLPHSLELRFVAHGAFEPPVWTRADRVDAAAVRERVLAEVARLARLLDGGEIGAFTEAAIPRYTDIARALPGGPDPATMRAIDEIELEAVRADPAFMLASIDPAAMRVAVEASGRLITCSRGDGTAALRARQSRGPVIDLPLAFAVIGGQLRVVR